MKQVISKHRRVLGLLIVAAGVSHQALAGTLTYKVTNNTNVTIQAFTLDDDTLLLSDIKPHTSKQLVRQFANFKVTQEYTPQIYSNNDFHDVLDDNNIGKNLEIDYGQNTDKTYNLIITISQGNTYYGHYQ